MVSGFSKLISSYSKKKNALTMLHTRFLWLDLMFTIKQNKHHIEKERKFKIDCKQQQNIAITVCIWWVGADILLHPLQSFKDKHERLVVCLIHSNDSIIFHHWLPEIKVERKTPSLKEGS